MCCCHDEKDVWVKERARVSGMFCHSEKDVNALQWNSTIRTEKAGMT
jgi:hypothetical protein